MYIAYPQYGVLNPYAAYRFNYRLSQSCSSGFFCVCVNQEECLTVVIKETYIYHRFMYNLTLLL